MTSKHFIPVISDPVIIPMMYFSVCWKTAANACGTYSGGRKASHLWQLVAQTASVNFFPPIITYYNHNKNILVCLHCPSLPQFWYCISHRLTWISAAPVSHITSCSIYNHSEAHLKLHSEIHQLNTVDDKLHCNTLCCNMFMYI